MQKKDFEKFFRDNMKGLPLEEQEKILKKAEYEWLPSIRQKFDERIEKSYRKCEICQKYSLKSKFSIEVKDEKEYGVLVYQDAGYGDDDEYADVTYKKIYYVCPLCGALILKQKFKIKVENARTRR